jgi:dTDP-glucose pyrophosphorylase
MAGRGSRFSDSGIEEPKPLIALRGRPFFWWAVESVRREVAVRQMIFVVLEEHCERFDIDRKILEFYPHAEIVKLDAVTAGAAETAKIGIETVRGNGPIAINDCDHAFVCPNLPVVADALQSNASGALLCFRSTSPAYSYLRLDAAGEIIGTVEKKVASPFAIAGCYMFSSASVFSDLYKDYSSTCPYDELFVSGLYDLLVKRDKKLLRVEADHHCSFGTPHEMSLVDEVKFQPYVNWKTQGQ